jgi:peptide deformylase
MPHQIVEDIKLLKTVCEPCTSVEEGKEIAEKLFLALSVSESGIGLAANQIGINKRVCVITASRPITLINPEIVSSFGKIMFDEGCLSFPEQTVRTLRSTNILVKADNLNGPVNYGTKDLNNFEKLLECICIQHEIDHLDGITMFDREFRGNFKSMEQIEETL